VVVKSMNTQKKTDTPERKKNENENIERYTEKEKGNESEKDPFDKTRRIERQRQ